MLGCLQNDTITVQVVKSILYVALVVIVLTALVVDSTNQWKTQVQCVIIALTSYYDSDKVCNYHSEHDTTHYSSQHPTLGISSVR
jgi:hypothetical protein